MAFFQVRSRYPGDSDTSNDHVVSAPDKAAAREYVNHRWSPAYGYTDPLKTPVLVSLRQIGEASAEYLIDSGAINWT